MRSAHQAHGLYSDCPQGAAYVIETAFVFTVFTALMEQQYAAKHRVEVRHEHAYSQPKRARMDLALLEPGPDGTRTLGACIETKLWGGSDQPVRNDIEKMRTLCPDPNVRKLMLLAWGLPDDSQELADWVESKARRMGLVIRPSWHDSFQASVYTGATTFSQRGRMWLALMETAAT
jgi:hypothetical protein